MKDPERRVPEAERVQDLEVREDDAREIAGGKRQQAMKVKGKKAGAQAQNLTENISLNKR